jgi:hypothetical protein
VLTPDVRFEGWTAEDWTRFIELWKPRASPEREPTRPRGGVVAVHAGGRLRKLVHTARGRLPLATEWPVPLGALANEHRASWALSLHVGALEEVMERFGARTRRGDDMTTQGLCLMQIVREMIAEDAIESWPQRLRGVPVPAEAMVRRAIDALCDDGRCIALGLFKDGALWTCFVARRRGHGFDVLAGPDELRPSMGLLSGDWRRDYRHFVRAVEERYAPLSLGCFSEVDTFRALQVDPRSGAWTRAVAVRDVALSPIPVAVGVALGVDSVGFALASARALTRRIDAFGFLDPLLRSARSGVGAATGGKDVSSLLGFDPLAALRALLER